MTGSNVLREDHKHIKRLDKIIVKCYTAIYAGKYVPLNDIEKITVIISEFLDSIHYSREEDSYFPCVSSYGSMKDEIKALLIEHEFSRRIASKISLHLNRWKQGQDAREPVARFLRTYSIYLNDHMEKEEKLFEKVESEILSREEEQDLYEQFLSVLAITKKVEHLIREINILENQQWCKV